MYSRQTIENKGLENITSSAATFLLKSSNHILVINGTNENQIINLGDATLYLPNKSLVLISNNTEVISVVNSGGTEIARLEPYNKIEFVLTDNTVPNGVWVQNITRPDTSKMTEFFDDFVSASIAGQTNWRTVVSGAGATATLSISLLDRIGVVFMNTGSTATGSVALMKNDANGNGSIIFGRDTVTVTEGSVYVQNLATVTENYTFTFPYIDQASILPQDGIYLEYDFTSSGNFWRIVTASNNVRSILTTTIPVIQNAWTQFRIETNRTGTSAKFFINNVFAGERTSNISTTIGRNTDLGFRNTKSAGTGIRPCYIDYIIVRYYKNR